MSCCFLINHYNENSVFLGCSVEFPNNIPPSFLRNDPKPNCFTISQMCFISTKKKFDPLNSL